MSDQLCMLGRREVGEVGDALDRHFTPLALALACIARVEELAGPGWRVPPWVIEPSVGGGAFLDASRRHWGPDVVRVGIDVDPRAEGLAPGLAEVAVVGDALDDGTACVAWAGMRGAGCPMRSGVVLGNPPFSRGDRSQAPPAQRHAAAAIELGEFSGYPSPVALIMPWSFLGGVAEWRGFWKRYPLHSVHPIERRPWGDKVREVALYVWPGGLLVGATRPFIGEPIRW